MVRLPRGSEVIDLLVATPPERVAVSRRVPEALPSKTLSGPVGVPCPPPEAATLTVKVTPWPQTEGLVTGVTVTELGDWFTVWLTLPVLAMKLPSPP